MYFDIRIANYGSSTNVFTHQTQNGVIHQGSGDVLVFIIGNSRSDV